MSSAITGEEKTFHMALATARFKDNRIPPKGFKIAQAWERLSEPVWEGQSAPNYFTAAEYEGGYDPVSLQIPKGATRIAVRIFSQPARFSAMPHLHWPGLSETVLQAQELPQLQK